MEVRQLWQLGGDWLRRDRQKFWCDENILKVGVGGRYRGAYHHQNSMIQKPKIYARFCMLFICQISHNNKNQQESIFKENFMLHYMACTIKKYSAIMSWLTSYSTFPLPGREHRSRPRALSVPDQLIWEAALGLHHRMTHGRQGCDVLH